MSVFSHDYIPLTQEQIEQAQHTDIIEWLKKRGEPLRKEGKYFIWLEHDSVRIQGYKWIQNSTKECGGAVHFLEHFFGMYFPDAVLELIGGQPANYSPATFAKKPLAQAEITKTTPAVFRLPKKNESMNRAYAYLAKTRCIDSDVIDFFANSIYEDTHHNAVFVGFDKGGVPRSAFKRGTNTYLSSYKAEQEGSDKRYSFSSRGQGNDLFIFEAAIDLMSYICLHKDHPWPQDSFISLGGLGDDSLVQFLKDYPHISNLYFCFDNDAAAKENHGQAAAYRYCKKYAELGYCCKIIKPTLKDWNEVLIARKSTFGKDAQ